MPSVQPVVVPGTILMGLHEFHDSLVEAKVKIEGVYQTVSSLWFHCYFETPADYRLNV